MKKFNKKFNETLDTLGEIGYWLGVRFERYIEENKDDILELLGILGAFFVMWILRHCKAVFFQKSCAGAVPCGHGINKSAV